MSDLDVSGLEAGLRHRAMEHITFNPLQHLYNRAGLYVPAVAIAVSTSRDMQASHHWAFFQACSVGEVPGRFHDYLAYREPS